MSSAIDPHNIDHLRSLALFGNLPAWQLQAVSEAVEPVSARKGQNLFECGSDDGYTYFLTEGRIAMESADGRLRELDVTPEVTHSPVANLRPRLYGVKALSKVQGFRIPDLVVKTAAADADSPDAAEGIHVEESEDGQRRELEHELGFRLYRDLRDDQAVLPSLPDLALRIRKAIEDGSSDARDIARVVETDPAMTAKLVKVANSALYRRRNPVETCAAAIVRLGTKATQKLVISFSMREVFQTRRPELQQRMQRLWAHSADVAALSFTLARTTRNFDPEEAMLAGLLHDVGAVAILNYAQSMPQLARDLDGLETTIGRLAGELGAMILRTWSFPPEIVAAAREADNWQRAHDGAADLADLVIVAQWHDRLRQRALASLPPLDQITALPRVLGGKVKPETSLELIKSAKAQIAEARAALEA